ncbi:MAG: LacI family DNA-binding transcriptional regulator [Terriglobia bacterium]
MKRSRVTINDVAREAGVSTAAVSQVLNSTGRISRPTSQKVLAAVSKLKYYPNHHAKGLASGVNRTLGIIVSDIENPFFSVLIKNYEAQARRYGFDVIVGETSYDLALMRRCAERMMEQAVSGVAIMTSEMSTVWLEEITQRNIPITCFDLGFISDQASNIKVNYASGMLQVVQHLYDLGHRRIAYVGGRRQLKNILSRLDGFLAAVRSLGLEPDPILTGNQRLDGGYAAGMEIAGMPSRPTAVVAVNDLTAVGLINAFNEACVRVPGDISVTGFDNTYLAAYFVPRLTTVDMHPDMLGRIAADALHEAIVAPGARAGEYAIKIDLVVGKSSGPVTAG